MSIIHHRHRTHPITFHSAEGCYRVHDPYHLQGVADHHLLFPYLSTAKRYVDAVQDALLLPTTENIQRLAVFYIYPRDDGPMPHVLLPVLPPQRPTDTCAHFHYVPERGGWCYCRARLKPGSTRCWSHERRFSTAMLSQDMGPSYYNAVNSRSPSRR